MTRKSHNAMISETREWLASLCEAKKKKKSGKITDEEWKAHQENIHGKSGLLDKDAQDEWNKENPGKVKPVKFIKMRQDSNLQHLGDTLQEKRQSVKRKTNRSADLASSRDPDADSKNPERLITRLKAPGKNQSPKTKHKVASHKGRLSKYLRKHSGLPKNYKGVKTLTPNRTSY